MLKLLLLFICPACVLFFIYTRLKRKISQTSKQGKTSRGLMILAFVILICAAILTFQAVFLGYMMLNS